MNATFDSRQVKPGMTFIALKGEKADGHDFIPQALEKGAARIIDGYDELYRAAHERRLALKAKVIGVTGSAGKTTTKELLRAFFSRLGRTYATEGNFNNHIGLPLTILNCPDDAEYLVLEMGTNHPGEIAHLCSIAEPDVGVLTNIGTAHIEFFKTREGIAREKGELLKAAKDFGVVSSEVYALDILRDLSRGRELLEVNPVNSLIAAAVSRVLPGAHNLSNASLAFAAAARFGFTGGEAAKALADFSLPGARWRITERGGVKFIDDTYNANPEAMIAALDAFAAMPCQGQKVAILGDMFELGEKADEYHEKVFAHAASLGLGLVVAVGEKSSKCLADMAFCKVSDFKPRFDVLFSPGDAVLLKASHSMNLGSLLR